MPVRGAADTGSVTSLSDDLESPKMIAEPGPDIGQTTSAVLRAGIDLPLRQVGLAAGSVDGPGALEGRVGITGAWQGEDRKSVV